MASEEFGRQVDRVAELLAQRAKLKMGLPPSLKLVEPESAQSARPAPAVALPDLATHEAVDVSPRAIKMHEIMRIAHAHGWQIAVRHFLMTKGVGYVSDLTDPQLDDLLDRMHGYVDAAEMGACMPDCLPAG